jgi:DNA adenine methylase
MFAKPWPDVSNNDHYREVLNDMNGDVVNFFRQLRDYPDDLVRVCCLTPYAREEHALSKNRDASIDGLERARRFFVSVSMSFSGKLDDSWKTSVCRTNMTATWTSMCSRLYACAERLRSVYIEHEDALRVIARWDSPQTLFYCDPPYPDANQGHYGGYTQAAFHSLVNKLNSIEGSFLLSCYDQPDIPEHWERFEFDAYCSASGKGKTAQDRSKIHSIPMKASDKKRTEVVWRVIRGQNVRPEIQKLYNQGKFDCFQGSVK